MIEQAQGGGSPAPTEYLLPSGRRVLWRQPDMFAILAFTGTLPDPITAAAIKLLTNEGAYTPTDNPLYYVHQAERIKGMYGLVAHGMVSPRLDVSKEWGDGDVLGRRDISFGDVEHLYWLFRNGDYRPDQTDDPSTDDARGAAAAPSTGDGVPE